MTGAAARVWLGVVLYRNSGHELRRLAASLALNREALAEDGLEVRWMDNSPDASLGPSVTALVPGSGYHHAGENLGFGAAHNRLMAEAFAAGAEHYVCVNPDAVLHPACVRELVAEADAAGPRAGLVEARQFPDEHAKPYDPDTHETAWCSGCVLLVTRALHAACGGFDPRFFMYCEDVDLSWRARAAGFSVRVAPGALAHHYIFGRPTDPVRERRVRRAGALLGAKYGHASFRDTCLRQYAALGGEPLAPPPLERPGRALARVADFGHLFDFSEVRW